MKNRSETGEEVRRVDALYIGIAVLFFAATLWLAAAIDRLMKA